MDALDSTLKRAAEALGVWREPGGGPRVGDWSIEPGVTVRRWAPDGTVVAELTTPTAALLLLGHAMGLRLDLGQCRACVGEREVATGVEWGGMHEYLPCPACSVEGGEPTGRESIDWTAAIEHALPGDEDICNGLGVLADRLQASGDVLGTWTAEWLAGPCPACRGCGASGKASDLCLRCNGHGTMLGAHEPALVEALVRIADRASLGA